jgi:hypothetical protein
VANALLKRLAFLPLAISQAAAYINYHDISLARYMSLLGEQEASTIELLGEEFADDGRYADIQNPVATTWLVSFLRLNSAAITADFVVGERYSSTTRFPGVQYGFCAVYSVLRISTLLSSFSTMKRWSYLPDLRANHLEPAIVIRDNNCLRILL